VQKSVSLIGELALQRAFTIFWIMRIDKYTQKMQGGRDLALQTNHPEITNEDFLSAVLDQSERANRLGLGLP
jgi:hypothetical protein